MSKFKLTSLLGKPKDAPMELKYIDIGFLLPDEKNNFNTEDIEDLKDSIELSGIQQPLKVVPVQDGLYRIIAGHRRFKACLALLEEGKERFKSVPCVVSESDGDPLDRIANIMTNLTARNITTYERMAAVAEYKAQLLALKEKGYPLPGRIRDYIARGTGMAKSEVGRLEQLQKNLAPGMKERLKDGEMNESEALKVATVEPDQQPQRLNDIREKAEAPKKEKNVVRLDEGETEIAETEEQERPDLINEIEMDAAAAVIAYLLAGEESERAAERENRDEREKRIHSKTAYILEKTAEGLIEKAHDQFGQEKFDAYVQEAMKNEND